ncbi:MAG TPA: AAA family ATPase [Pseudonocardiaceae bacterium]|nr:AAA family ATPase [Pseudonocardiaceae bacterium]
MRDSIKPDAAQLIDTIVRDLSSRTNLLWQVEHDLRARLPLVIQEQAATVIPAMVSRAVARATPDTSMLQRNVEERVRANVSDLVSAEADRIMPELARQAVADVKPDLDEVEGELARRVERHVIRSVRREADRTIPEAVEKTSIDALGKFARLVADFIETELETALDTIAGSALNEVRKALADFTPNLVQVVLPAGPRIDLDADCHRSLPEVVTAVHAGCHVLLAGAAGAGKATLARQVAEALGLAFHFGPNAVDDFRDSTFLEPFEHGGVVLFDGLDRTPPAVLTELNHALAQGMYIVAGQKIRMHQDFRVIATATVQDSAADRYPELRAADPATLDRFVIIDVPIDEALEERIALRHAPDHHDLVRGLLEEVRGLRGIAEEKQLPVSFSPRVSIDGARLLQAGATLEQVMRWRVLRGLAHTQLSALGFD